MAEVAVFGMHFKHPYTGVNGVRKRDWSIRNPSSPIAVSSLFSAPVKLVLNSSHAKSVRKPTCGDFLD